MSDAAPPPWVRKLSKREHGVDAGLKVLLITAWGFGPYQRQGPVETDGGRMPSAPVVIYPCAETLAEESGQPLGTVKDQLRRAARLGWIRRDTGSKFTLAWREPGCFEYGERPAGRPSRTVDQPDGGPTMPTGAPTCPDGGPTCDRTVGRPQTFQGTSNSTSSDLAAAHATPSESTTPDGNTQYDRMASRTHPPPTASGASAASAALPEHVKAKHARVRRELDTRTPALPGHVGTPSTDVPVTQNSHAKPARKSNGSPVGRHNPSEPSGPPAATLDLASFKLIEAHDGGRWAVALMDQRWVSTMAEAMADLNIDAERVCAVLDVWTDHTRDGVTTGIPARRELWWAGGKRGSIVARPWLLRALEATRPKLRVVSGESEYERAKAWAHR